MKKDMTKMYNYMIFDKDDNIIAIGYNCRSKDYINQTFKDMKPTAKKLILERNIRNYQIKDSYKITSIAEMTSIIRELWNKGKLGSSRSIMSYVKEWHAHNILYKYGIAINSTKDADLN